MKHAVLLAALAAVPTSALAQNIHPTPPPQTRAVALHGEKIHLDGRLDERVWHTAPAATDFRQSQPHEGEPATQRTEVRFAYDDAALYVGARMFDTDGANGVRTRLVRRDDNPNSDYLEVIFDTYHDHIGRLFFQVNPSGVRYDANGLGGGADESWDPVWEVQTAIDSLGWTAEMRIPFSQLRYPRSDTAQTWGLQIWRQENRLNELSQWAFWKRTDTGGPAQFGHLAGLTIDRTPEHAEIMPYVVGRSNNVPVSDPANPFETPHVVDDRVGVDASMLLTSNLTLNATVNPDFGQVEVDPAVVNLSAFETFYEEKRPFFVEGAGYFGFGGLWCFFCSNTSSLSLFYSRRIGRAPQGAENAEDAGPYAQVPDNTTILGAAKLTGRTRSGWSLGFLDAATRRESALVQLADSSRARVEVEPFTNYFVGRVGMDLRGGATTVRVMATSVVRQLDDTFFTHRLSRHAESLGLATESWFDKRNYHLMTQVAGTQLAGDAAAMLLTQQSSAHYFQRPDRGNGGNGLLSSGYDSSLTSMRGLGAYARFSREQGHVLWEVSTNLRTPGFENNDIAYLSRADYWWMSANVFPQWTKPTSWYRNLFFIVGGQQQYNFEGDLTDRQAQLFSYIELPNYWEAQTFWIHRPSVLDDRLSRGGPVLRRPSSNFWSTYISTDSRKAVVGDVSAFLGCDGDGNCSPNASLSLKLRPASNISLSLGPSWERDRTAYQYVTTVDDPTATTFFGKRYVFADLVQHSISMDTRVNVTFTPNLTFELYAQPLIASGQYSRYKEFAAPRELKRLVYGEDIGTVSVQHATQPGDADIYTIDPDGAGPAASFEVTDPSFTLRSLRGNAVLRWEYLPGSTLYLVWTRSASSDVTRGSINFGPDAGALFQGPATNIFLIKLNYWLGM
jgi:hypothetical protein